MGFWDAAIADGVLASAVWSTANQTLTLTLADGTTIQVALSGLETQAEVAARDHRGTREPAHPRRHHRGQTNITISNGIGKLA